MSELNNGLSNEDVVKYFNQALGPNNTNFSTEAKEFKKSNEEMQELVNKFYEAEQIVAKLQVAIAEHSDYAKLVKNKKTFNKNDCDELVSKVNKLQKTVLPYYNFFNGLKLYHLYYKLISHDDTEIHWWHVMSHVDKNVLEKHTKNNPIGEWRICDLPTPRLVTLKVDSLSTFS